MGSKIPARADIIKRFSLICPLVSKTMMKSLSFLFSFLLFSLIGHSQQSKWLSSVTIQLQLNPKKCHRELVSETLLPFSKAEVLLILPYYTSKDENIYSCDLYVLIVNNSTGQIVSKYYEKNAISSDAMQFTGIKPDFAPYRVTTTDRAFGIRTSYTGSSNANPYSHEQLYLFIRKEGKLVKVLDNYTVERYSGEWDTNCAGEFEDEKKTISISTNQTQGFYDLIVKRRLTHIVNTPKGEECIEKVKHETISEILKYKGGLYK